MTVLAGWKSLPLPLCLGGSVFGWLISKPESDAVLDRFFEFGGRLIDTSDAYSFARRVEGLDSESIIGAWARSRGVLAEIRVCTKVGLSPDLRGLERDTVRTAVSRSQERVGVTAFEAVLAHSDDLTTAPDEIADALGVVRDTMALHVGLSNFAADRAAAVLTATDARGRSPIDLIQEEFNLASRSFEDSPLGELAASANLSLMATGALAQGFLTGKFHNAVGRVGHRQHLATERYAGEQFDELLNVLALIANRHSVSMAATALRWIVDNHWAIPIASVTRPEQLDAFREAGELELTVSDLSMLQKASSPARVSRPGASGSRSP